MSSAPGWSTAPDEEIIRRVQQGERTLFSIVFERYYARLERFARHLGVADADLEDVLAETFTRALARVQSFRTEDGTRYVSYLYSIARNLVMDRRREQLRTPPMTLLEDVWPEPESWALGSVDHVLRQEEVDRIRRAMQRLSRSDREIITLSYDREMSCREIMQVMGKPSVSAVTTHLYKAMKRLRELVLVDEAAYREDVSPPRR
jgi:RNA polymerase sigma-70 factor (ECF subfamily)